MSEPGYVIAVCGASGAGKSTVMEFLMALLGDSVSLRMDDYRSSNQFPDLARWLEEGADPNQFQSPQFDSDLSTLRGGGSITLPETQESLGPARFILVEVPFGRERESMRGLIDWVVYIDVPPEIALVRQILRKSPFLPWEKDPDVFLHHLRDFLTWYIQVGRSAYQAMLPIALKHSDQVIDGTLPPEQIAEKIYSVVLHQRQRT